MGILTSIKSWLTFSQKTFRGGYLSTYREQAPEFGMQDYLEAYGSDVWVYACINKIAEAVAEADFKLYRIRRNGEKEEIQSHPLLDLLYDVNPYMSKYDLLQAHQMYFDSVGESFWVIERDRMGKPAEIWPVPPQRLKVVPDPVEYIRGYVYEIGGKKIPIEPQDIIFFRLPHPTNPYRGLGPLQAARYAIGSNKYSNEWTQNMFFNSAVPEIVLETENSLDPQTFERLKAEWSARYAGYKNARRAAVLEGGVKVKPLSLTPKDMDFVELRKMSRTEILAVFGIHPSILGLTEDVNRANAETGEYTFARWVIRPRLKRLVDKLNQTLVPMFGEDLELGFVDPVPTNREARIKELETSLNKWRTVNEIRKEEGLPPIEGGDVILVQGTVVPLSQVGQQQQQQALPDNNGENGGKAIGQLDLVKKKLAEAIRSVSIEERWYAFVKATEPQEKNLERQLKKLFQEQQNEIMDKLKNNPQKPADILPEFEPWYEATKAIIMPAMQKALQEAGERAVNEVRQALDKSGVVNITKELDPFDVYNPLVVEWLEYYAGNDCKLVTETTITQLRDSLIEAYLAGESIPKIAERVSAIFAEAKENRAKTIARTEIIAASNQGAYFGYKQTGVIEKKGWLAALDERTRQAHVEAGQKYGDDEGAIPLDEPFLVGGEYLNAPGDPSASAKNRINCRCTIIPVIKV